MQFEEGCVAIEERVGPRQWRNEKSWRLNSERVVEADTCTGRCPRGKGSTDNDCEYQVFGVHCHVCDSCTLHSHLAIDRTGQAYNNTLDVSRVEG